MGRKKSVSFVIKIGEAARLAGLSIDTIRFYQREGLLKQPPRTEGGFRLFGSEEIRALRFIRKAQELGFSLMEIRDLLFLESGQAGACSHVQELLERKLSAVRGKIAELRKLESRLSDGLRRCRRELKRNGNSHGAQCPVLAEISRHARPRRSQQ